ncbi:MAG TPA: hypothetical protein DDX98_10985 [Bacteroidales bacterium]|jgi:hypothetical protein|nr:hypothetical protein [Bacteroidales bacterium]
MYSKIVFALPIVSLIYLLQTIFFKPIRRLIRVPLAIFALAIFIFDLLVSLYFFSSCFEMVVSYGHKTCLSWIYPTLDFKIMVLVSVLLLTLSVWAMVAGWQRRAFYLIGASVLYLGVFFRILIFLQSMRVTAITGSVNSAIIFEFFTILVIYGLVSSVIYSCVSLMGFFRRFTYDVE